MININVNRSHSNLLGTVTAGFLPLLELCLVDHLERKDKKELQKGTATLNWKFVILLILQFLIKFNRSGKMASGL